jgi:anti-anti-sigma regulatory factor
MVGSTWHPADGSAVGLPPRAAGPLSGRTTATVNDHGCRSYLSDEQRARLVSAWLLDGLRLGQRMLYVAEADPDTLLAEVAAIPDAAALVDAGALVVQPSEALYDLSTPIDPPVQLALYVAAVEAAIADGYDGLRVAADITPLIADPARLASHLAWEQYADRYIAASPLAPLCLYDVRRVTSLPSIVCVHPLQGPEPTPFAFYAVTARQGMLAGEVDACSVDLLADVLRAMPEDDDLIDVRKLSFIDGRAALTLHREVRRRRALGQRLAISGASPLFRRVWQLCGFDETLLRAS